VNIVLGGPAIASLIALVIAWHWSPHSRADHAAKMLTGTLVLTSLSVVAAVSVYAVAWMVPVEQALWCRRMLGHSIDHRPVAGAIVFTTVMLVAARGGWIAKRIVRIWRTEAYGRAAIDIEEGETPYAYSVPNLFPKRGEINRGTIVVSTAMLASLTADEKTALFAHEAAHLRFGHHRYLLTGRIVAAVVPPLRPMTKRLDWLLERWADEVAAQQVGDREIVATAIAHAALSTNRAPEAAFLGFASDSILTRVEALFAPPRTSFVGANLMLVAGLAGGVFCAITQIHHLVGLVQHMAH
jgi:Zn-dependent protease with chaperone function